VVNFDSGGGDNAPEVLRAEIVHWLDHVTDEQYRR
jgi:hypothetical protein